MRGRPWNTLLVDPVQVAAYTIVIGALALAGCGKSASPAAPAPVDPPSAAPVTLFRVSGVVADKATAEPVAGAHVEVVEGPASGMAVDTDSDGTYRIDDLSPGAFSLRATAPDFEPAIATVTVNDNVVLNFELTRSTGQAPEPGRRLSLTGAVIDAGTGVPLPDAVIEWLPKDEAGRKVTSDADGLYTIAGLEPATGEVHAGRPGFVSRTFSLTIESNQTLDIALTREAPPGPTVSGRVVGALSDGPLSGVSVRISGGGSTTTADDGAFSLTGSAGGQQRVTLSSDSTVERETSIRLDGEAPTVTLIPRSLDLRSFNEMLRTRGGLHRWIEAPRLVVQRSVLVFTDATDTKYVATAATMSEAEVDQLLSDLRWALAQLTGEAFADFASVDVVTAADGDTVTVSHPGTIVVARYDGLDAAIGAWGYGRWAWGGSGEVRTSILMLDNDFDRNESEYRRSLRAHELGHTLGYDHVMSGVSVMNKSGRVEPTPFDRDATRIAFLRQPLNAAPDVDPDPITVNRVASHVLTWGGAR